MSVWDEDAHLVSSCSYVTILDSVPASSAATITDVHVANFRHVNKADSFYSNASRDIRPVLDHFYFRFRSRDVYSSMGYVASVSKCLFSGDVT